MYIFISHSSKEAKVANEICEAIEKGEHRCFLAPRDIRTGMEYAEELVEGIDRSDAVLLILSANSIASPHVLREIERAVSKKIPIIVYKLEEVVLTKSMEYFLMTHQWLNAKPGEGYGDIICAIDNIRRTPESKKEGVAPESPVQTENVVKKAGEKKKYLPEILIVAVLAVVIFIAVFDIFSNGNKNTEAAVTIDVELGDTIVFGNYNNEPIKWRVLKIAEDGKTAVLVTSNIITMKAYDAAEGGEYGSENGVSYYGIDTEADKDLELQIRVRGNNDWSKSNIRTWLNSESEVVYYEDQPPLNSAMSEGRNGYSNEPGFLYGFTEQELEAIVATENVTKGNVLAESDIITTDRVYLLSLEELEWFKTADISIYAKPTQAALDQDVSQWYEVAFDAYGMETYNWWLREPYEGTTSKCYTVGSGYVTNDIRFSNVGAEGYGIRPAITVDLTSDQIVIE